METIEHETRVWRTAIIAGSVTLAIVFSGASYCGKTVSDNYSARAKACMDAKSTWIPNGGDGLCLVR